MQIPGLNCECVFTQFSSIHYDAMLASVVLSALTMAPQFAASTSNILASRVYVTV